MNLKNKRSRAKLSSISRRLSTGISLTVAASLIAGISLTTAASAQNLSNQTLKPARRMDMSKAAIEIPLKRMIKSEDSPAAPRKPDISKLRIEAPLKSMLKTSAAPDLFKSLETKGELEKLDNAVPISAPPAVAIVKVKPGLISWHKNLTAAMKSASKSGKPVLVFHMMGSLDDRFC